MIFDTDPLFRQEDWEHFKYRLPRHLTNMDAQYADLILEAAELTGFDIEVCDAADEVTREVGNSVAVYTYEPHGKDHSPFWEAFHELQATTLEYGWCRYCEIIEATGPDQLCDGCREYRGNKQPPRPFKRLLAKLGSSVGCWDYVPGLDGHPWWVTPTYHGGFGMDTLERLFPLRAVPF